MSNYKGYDSLSRFISYYYQIDLVRELDPKSVLEVGIGNKTTANYLKQNGFAVTTCDIDGQLKPDVMADIRSLPFADNSFDCVLACEVLEHLPWEDCLKAMKELQRVSKKNIIVSVPLAKPHIEFVLKTRLLAKIGYPIIDLCLRLPNFIKKEKHCGEHFWEIGQKNYSMSKIREALSRDLRIIREVEPILYRDRHFFVLEKT